MSDIDEARVRRYIEILREVSNPGIRHRLARAVIAVADEEQAALRAEVERLKWLVQHHADIYAGACEDAS